MFLLIFAILLTIYWFGFRPLMNIWGTSPAEELATYPGDEIIATPQTVSTRAITVNAPASVVWKWLVQIGQGRGGFYSFDLLENLFGLDIHSVNEIIPDLQTLEVGDVIHLAPENPQLKVVELKPNYALVLRALNAKIEAFPSPKSSKYYDMTWAFILQPVDEYQTRFVIRGRGFARPLPMRLMNLALEPITFTMEWKMLRGVKSRAEKTRQMAL